MKKFSLFLLLFIGLFILACNNKIDYSNTLYVPTEADATANATLDELKQGRELYINNCNKCHVLYSPDDYSVSNWNGIIPSMARKTSLSSQEVDLVTKYLTRGQ